VNQSYLIEKISSQLNFYKYEKLEIHVITNIKMKIILLTQNMQDSQSCNGNLGQWPCMMVMVYHATIDKSLYLWIFILNIFI